MTDDQLDEWLTIAAGDLAHLPIDVLQYACREARKSATHHGQIVPAILRAGEAKLEERRRHIAFVQEFHSVAQLPSPDIEPPAAGEVRELQSIIDKAAGKFRDAELDRWAERRADQASLRPKVTIDPDAPKSLADLVAKWDANKASGGEGEALQ